MLRNLTFYVFEEGVMAHVEPRDDEFELYDLAVVVEAIEGHCTCTMAVGDTFFLRGGKLSIPDGRDFCLYALQAAIPLLPAKQRRNHPADWIETDARVTCPEDRKSTRLNSSHLGIS